jgi:hypothetical protein
MRPRLLPSPHKSAMTMTTFDDILFLLEEFLGDIDFCIYGVALLSVKGYHEHNATARYQPCKAA